METATEISILMASLFPLPASLSLFLGAETGFPISECHLLYEPSTGLKRESVVLDFLFLCGPFSL